MERHGREREYTKKAKLNLEREIDTGNMERREKFKVGKERVNKEEDGERGRGG